ncbi:MAG: hypothetical protein PVJ01_05170, partial [Pseudomonadota bacterium]
FILTSVQLSKSIDSNKNRIRSGLCPFLKRLSPGITRRDYTITDINSGSSCCNHLVSHTYQPR